METMETKGKNKENSSLVITIVVFVRSTISSPAMVLSSRKHIRKEK